MSTVTRGRLFKNTIVKCDDPLNLDCSFEYRLYYDESKALSYCLENGWHQVASEKLACPNCWGKQNGNYNQSKTIEDLGYTLVFQNGVLSRIDLLTNSISIENVLSILDQEITDEDIKKTKLTFRKGGGVPINLRRDVGW